MTHQVTIIRENKISRVSDLDLVIFLKNKGVKNTYRTTRWGRLELSVDAESLNLAKSIIANEFKMVIRGGVNYLRFS